MAKKAKPAETTVDTGKKKRGSKTLRDKINGIDTLKLNELMDELHAEHDSAEEDAAASRGKINRIYEHGCDKLGLTKDALGFFFKEARRQRKTEAKARKMDTQARDSLDRLGAAMGDTPMGKWATDMAKLEPSATPTESL